MAETGWSYYSDGTAYTTADVRKGLADGKTFEFYIDEDGVKHAEAPESKSSTKKADKADEDGA